MSVRLILVCVFLFVLSFIPRMYRLDNPVADWHSWRQADTAAMSRNFIQEGFTPLLPKSDSFYALNANEGVNPNRYFLAEFPLYNILTYPLYKHFGVHEYLARLVSITASSLTAVVLFLLVRRLSGFWVGSFAGLVFALLPYNIYYGRVIMPDPLHVFLGVTTLYFVLLWTERRWSWFAPLAGLVFAGTILTKPYGLVLLLPMAVLLLWRYGWRVVISPSVWVFFLISFLPFAAWRYHIEQYPEGMFGTEWLFNDGNIRFTGAFFHWLVFDRMNRLIFATGGFVLFFLGLISTRKHVKEAWFTVSWLAAILVFFCVIAKGNVTHDYYQLPIVPIGAYFIAKGLEWLLIRSTSIGQTLLNWSVGFSLALLMLALGWYETRGFYNINHWEIVRAGQAVEQLTPASAKVIAPYGKDPAFLYQTNRNGWTIGGAKIAEFIQQGATHLVSVEKDADTQYWMQRCTVIKDTDEYVLVDLTQCRKDQKSAGSISP